MPPPGVLSFKTILKRTGARNVVPITISKIAASRDGVSRPALVPKPKNIKPDEILAEFGVNDKVASAIEKTKPVLNEVRTETGAEAWDMVTVLLVHLASLHSSERLDKDVIITMLWYMMLQNEDMLDRSEGTALYEVQKRETETN